ncbi:uncharacterized protein BXIN_2168 [Babesia sp. Xinjiang]|uniref:uncharacterized protein n=1 Tax=Babesia sp. Xinjiang TaxID=462227 RepID=UPI000A236948|nr:uncharacterized protein BXIN_2168 [Babesia sp. Xinjiang]ORM40453.1 hypothetical protein BXIN_2168 [Babesia sp. Xinjiang]
MADGMDAALRAASFTDMGEVNDEIIDSVVSEMLSLLEQQGVSFENPEHMNHLISFVQTMARDDKEKSKSTKFLEQLKQMAKKTWDKSKGVAKDVLKDLLANYTKTLLKSGLKHALPALEKLNEKAMTKLPPNLRVALAPIYFNMWLSLFKHAKLAIPAGYNIEKFVCSSLTKDECDAIIEKVQGTWSSLTNKSSSKVKSARSDSDDLSDLEAEETKGTASRRPKATTSSGDDFDLDF